MKYLATIGSETIGVDIETRDDGMRVSVGGNVIPIDLGPAGGDGTYSLLIDGRSYTATLLELGESCRVMIDGIPYEFTVEDADLARLRKEVKRKKHTGAETVKAPMPGRVLAVEVSVGDTVKAGQGLVIIEAMKMENELRTHVDAKVKEVRVKNGDAVNKGDVLVVLEG